MRDLNSLRGLSGTSLSTAGAAGGGSSASGPTLVAASCGWLPDPPSTNDYRATVDFAAPDAGDLIISFAWAGTDYSASTVISTSGYTEFFEYNFSGIRGVRDYYKVSDGTETQAVAESCRAGGGFVLVLRGVAVPTGADAGDADAAILGSGTPLVIPAMSYSDYDAILFFSATTGYGFPFPDLAIGMAASCTLSEGMGSTEASALVALAPGSTPNGAFNFEKQTSGGTYIGFRIGLRSA